MEVLINFFALSALSIIGTKKPPSVVRHRLALQAPLAAIVMVCTNLNLLQLIFHCLQSISHFHFFIKIAAPTGTSHRYPPPPPSLPPSDLPTGSFEFNGSFESGSVVRRQIAAAQRTGSTLNFLNLLHAFLLNLNFLP